MDTLKKQTLRTVIFLVMGTLFLGCASSIFKYEKSANLNKIDEFDKQVEITPLANSAQPAAPPAATALAQPLTPAPESKKKKRKKMAKKVPAVTASAPTASIPDHRQPELESDVGFQGRRPLVDPVRVGEKLTYDVIYLGLTAATLSMEVKPFAMVNGHKCYDFSLQAQTRSIFASVYALDDKVNNLIDYATLVPRVFTLHYQEAEQLREARALFDETKNQATYWERKVTKKDGEKERKLVWDMPEYSQNAYSAIFYLRFFHWDVGTENAFRVTDDGQNLIFKATALRKEKLSTEVGEFNTIVLKPEVQLRGVVKPLGDVLIWLSDDEHHYVLRMEGKIHIGTLKLKVVEITPGQEPGSAPQQ